MLICSTSASKSFDKITARVGCNISNRLSTKFESSTTVFLAKHKFKSLHKMNRFVNKAPWPLSKRKPAHQQKKLRRSVMVEMAMQYEGLFRDLRHHVEKKTQSTQGRSQTRNVWAKPLPGKALNPLAMAQLVAYANGKKKLLPKFVTLFYQF